MSRMRVASHTAASMPTSANTRSQAQNVLFRISAVATPYPESNPEPEDPESKQRAPIPIVRAARAQPPELAVRPVISPRHHGCE